MYSNVRWNQFLAGFLSSVASFGFGNSYGWTSPVGIKLVGENEYFKLTVAEFGWVASIVNIGCIFSAILAVYTLDRLGRKKTMLMLTIPTITGWIILTWAQNLTMMLTGRLLCGFAGAYCLIGPQYTSEISEKEIRGVLGTFMQLLFVNGLLFVYVVGAFVSIFWLNVICGLVPIIFGILFIFMPESPYFLIANGRKNEAILALKWLRGANYDMIIREVEEIEEEFEKHQMETVSFKEAFHNRATYKATLIAFGLMFFFNFSGMVIVHFFAKNILEAANTGMSSDLSSIIIGLVKVLSTCLAPVFVDRAGRKILLMISSVSMALCLTILGVYYILKDHDLNSIGNLEWLPLTILSAYSITFAFGMGAIPWVLISEIFCYQVKPIMIPASLVVFFLIAFVWTNIFGVLTEAIGVGQTFWIFGVFTGLAAIFEYFFIPETKAKSLLEVQEILGRK